MKRTDRDPIDKLRTGVLKSVSKELQKLGVSDLPRRTDQHAEKRAA